MHTQGTDQKSVTMLTNVVSQNPLIGESFSTVFTHKGLWVEHTRT